MRFMFPLPFISTVSEAASCALMLSALRFTSMVKSPTPPPNDAGAPEGRGLTFIVADGVESLFLTVWYVSKKLSNIDSPPPEVRICIWHTIYEGSTVRSPVCCGKRM